MEIVEESKQRTDKYVNTTCVDGNCPLIVEDEKYGAQTSTCADYCGEGFHGCEHCYWGGGEMCEDCIHQQV